MKRIAIIAYGLLVIALGSGVVWAAFLADKKDILGIGNFVILSLTLVTLIWYAYDTNAMARVSSERWRREAVLGTTYQVVHTKGRNGNSGRTLIRIQNPSTLVVTARLSCNVKVCGCRAPLSPLFSGKDEWLLFPKQTAEESFEIEYLISAAASTVDDPDECGLTYGNLAANDNPVPMSMRLTMDIEMEFRDELGERRKLPVRPYYFDFQRSKWVPCLSAVDARNSELSLSRWPRRVPPAI